MIEEQLKEIIELLKEIKNNNQGIEKKISTTIQSPSLDELCATCGIKAVLHNKMSHEFVKMEDKNE